ncbi:GIY-YIG nuclease family protein [Phreatobacter aquaticus]|uniref:GIY-YIG nuclease family protein n=1 Tax=Phreatobacter aquaticus TaxID=2570229 RepID=A0A4D7QGD9_9HYPH|nr:GIY-YIG nuclease family protein [Phreatobacter aquaticus]QCK84447.1 GIY-YIG nuclease family protein [Phreatobacter aquaticus]
MTTLDRKAAIAAYKERKASIGIFAVRCASTGQTWVGGSRHLDNHRNGLWFSLKSGSFPNRALQAEWNRHGEAAFTFEALEQFGEIDTPYLQQAKLQERAEFWRNRLSAERT